MSLYLKYRPRVVDDLDLAGVRVRIGEIIKSGNIAHAYLLTGPRGAGKTSTARIISRIVNCEKNSKNLGEPCNECRACKAILNGSSMDFIEIDAASNRGIDDIRELKDKVRLAPSELKYKVYIIDEVHMLTTEAFNALLKTLEEPPEHAIFILCTTETHKVPETILSRCVHIQFSKATPEEMVRTFKRVIKGEGKSVSEEGIAYLARAVDGSFRDGVKVLDIVLSQKDKVELADIESVVAGSAGFSSQALVGALENRMVGVALDELHKATNKGVDLSFLLLSAMKKLRDRLMSGGNIELTKLVFALDDVARKVALSPVPELLVEMVIIEWCGEGVDEKKVTPNGGSSEPEKKVQKKEEVQVDQDHDEVWKKLMSAVGGNSITMGALLSKATPARLSGDELTITVGYDFHRDQIMSERVLSKLEKAVSEVVGRNMKVKCEVGVNTVGKLSMSEGRANEESGTIEEAIAIFS